jgi:hypothetical protein
MRLSIKILLALIITFLLISAVIYLFLVSVGKSIIITQLEELTHKKVSIGYFGLTSPFHLELKNLDIEGLIKVDSIFISPCISGFLAGNIAFNAVKIIRPTVVFEKAAPATQELTAPTPPTSAAPSAPADTPAPAATSAPAVNAAIKESEKKEPLRLIFKRLKIKEGQIDFIDRTVTRDGLKITIKDLDFNLTNLYLFPRSAITNFELRAKIPWQQGSEEGKIEAQGWINLFKKDMQAFLKIEDIDGIYLYPYYSNWVDLEKARIGKAKLNFTSNVQGLNNNVTAQCRLELTDIVRKPRLPEEAEEKAEKITNVVLGILRSLNQGKIVLDFTIRTRMDRPEFTFGDIKTAFEDKLTQGRKTDGISPQDVLVLPGKVIQGTFKGLTDMTTAVLIGTISVGKEIGKVFRDTLKKEEK